MTPLERALRAAVNAVIAARWNLRLGRVVPTPDTVILGGGAVDLDCTILYADLARSSHLASTFDRRIAAKAVKAFITCATRLVAFHRGTVVSFDGDRIMAVFVGDLKNTNAVTTALRLNYAVKNILAPRLTSEFAALRESGFVLRHGAGIDTGVTLAVRTGMRQVNDLVWIGRSPNLAARLSEIREASYATYITSAVYSKLPDRLKFDGAENEPVWERRTFKWRDESIYLYRSLWTQQP